MAEKEEYEFYHGRVPQDWLDALAPMGTDEHKPYLETAPYLIVVFAESYGLLPDGRKVQALLRRGIGRHCHRDADYCHSPCRFGFVDPHAQSDGLSELNPRAAKPRKSFLNLGSRLPGGEC